MHEARHAKTLGKHARVDRVSLTSSHMYCDTSCAEFRVLRRWERRGFVVGRCIHPCTRRRCALVFVREFDGLGSIGACWGVLTGLDRLQDLGCMYWRAWDVVQVFQCLGSLSVLGWARGRLRYVR